MLLGIAASMAIPCNLFAANEKEGIVRGSYINVRAEPKFNSQIIGKKLRGDTYKIKNEQQNWLHVEFKDNTEGWIYRTLIETSSLIAKKYNPVNAKIAPAQFSGKIFLPKNDAANGTNIM